MALAGGISLRVPQLRGYLAEDGGIESADGHSRTFDAKAGGTVFGEGVGMVVLKRLEDALADGDVIHAVIKGSAINNDGSMKAGFSTPSVEGQAEVVAMALANAGVDAQTIDYVEASGTATELGDPIEVASLTRAFRSFTEETNFCVIGSIKPNVGHPDRAAGVLGLIKTVEAMKHEWLPPMLFFETPNPKIDFAASPFLVSAEPRPWKKKALPRRAGVNSVGAGGTNAHVILEETPSRPPSDPGRATKLILLSARTAPALESMTANLLQYLEVNPDANLDDVAYTLQVGRRCFLHRRVIVSRDRSQLLDALCGKQPDSVFTHLAESRGCSTGFIFPDASGAYEGMAAQLYRSEASFREEVEHCCELFEPVLDVDLCQLFTSNSQEAKSVPVQHALTFAAEYAMARLLMSWGVTPQAMIGDGTGAILAGTLSGCFSLQGAVSLVCARARAIATRTADRRAASAQLAQGERDGLLELLRKIDFEEPEIHCFSAVSGERMTAE